MNIARLAPSVLLALCAGAACAADWKPSAAFVAEGGVTVHGTYSLTVGAAWPSAWRRTSHNGEWTAATEVFVSHWSARVEHDEREALTQVGVLPVFRYRFDHGRSPWFAEGGIGLTYTDSLYRTNRKQFTTRFNFMDVLGVGRTFGARSEHDVSLRIAHVSNAGIKNPNPGENFVQLRYSRNF